MVSAAATKLEADLAAAVEQSKVPHAIVYATNADGSFEYHHAVGYQHYGVNDEPIQEDAILMLASMTKLLTTIAVLKAVELGYTTLDEDILPHIPELAEKKIITGFDEHDKPMYKDRIGPITLRHLLTHTAGLDYGLHPLLVKWSAHTGHDAPELANSGEVFTRFRHPLVFEPGTSWMYSPGLDFAGVVLARVTGQSLEAFSSTHLWTPLGIRGEITFWPRAQTPSLAPRIPTLAARADPAAKLTPHKAETINSRAAECMGGHGAYASARAYGRVLRSLLADDGALLARASVAELFRPQLNAPGRAGLRAMREDFGHMIPGEQPLHVPVDAGLGGMVYLADDDGRRRAGTLSWSGMTNPFWLVDRAAGVALVFGTQVLPSGDAGCKEVTGVVERAVYKMLEEAA